MENTELFLRLEPASAVPVYRQILDQIRLQVATGILRPGDQMPSVRQLAARLAVNQNTVLKVYTQLCHEGVLCVERGSGTYVAAAAEAPGREAGRQAVATAIRQGVLSAVQLGVGLDEIQRLVQREYEAVCREQSQQRSTKP